MTAPHDSSTSVASAAPLSYGTAPDLRRRRRRRVVLSLSALLLIGSLILTNHLLQPVWDQATHLRAQYRIAHQLLPQGTVIFTEEPARIAALRTNEAYQFKIQGALPRGVFFPDALEREQTSILFSARDPGATKNSRYQTSDTFGQLRTSRGGVEWIVVLHGVSVFHPLLMLTL